MRVSNGKKVKEVKVKPKQACVQPNYTICDSLKHKVNVISIALK